MRNFRTILFLLLIIFFNSELYAFNHKNIRINGVEDCSLDNLSKCVLHNALGLLGFPLTDEKMLEVYKFLDKRNDVNEILLSKEAVISADVFKKLLQYTHVKSLHFFDMKLDEMSLTALANAPYLEELGFHKWNSTKPSIVNNDVMLLSKSKVIKRLYLYDAVIYQTGVKALANLKSLELLDISKSSILSEGAVALSTSNSIRILDISENSIGDEGLGAFGNNSSVEELYANNNGIGSTGVTKFSRNNNDVKILSLNNNRIGAEGAIYLARLALNTLHLSHAGIGDEGAIALSKNNSIKNISLGSNLIGDEGAIALSKNQHLIELSLYNNRIEDEGAIALAKNTTLKYLDVELNRIWCPGLEALKANKKVGINMDSAACP